MFCVITPYPLLSNILWGLITTIFFFFFHSIGEFIGLFLVYSLIECLQSSLHLLVSFFKAQLKDRYQRRGSKYWREISHCTLVTFSKLISGTFPPSLRPMIEVRQRTWPQSPIREGPEDPQSLRLYPLPYSSHSSRSHPRHPTTPLVSSFFQNKQWLKLLYFFINHNFSFSRPAVMFLT